MIVKSILDTDLYKFTTSYAYMKLFPHAIGTFEFFDRDNTEYTEEFVQQLWIEISNFCSLKLTHDEIIKEFTEWMHLEDGDLDMQDIDLDPV